MDFSLFFSTHISFPFSLVGKLLVWASIFKIWDNFVIYSHQEYPHTPPNGPKCRCWRFGPRLCESVEQVRVCFIAAGRTVGQNVLARAPRPKLCWKSGAKLSSRLLLNRGRRSVGKPCTPFEHAENSAWLFI